MRMRRRLIPAAVALATMVMLTGCIADSEEAQSFAANDVGRVKAAIGQVHGRGFELAVTAESTCSEGCLGVVVIEQTAGEMQVADVLAVHEAIRDVRLSRTFLWSNSLVLRLRSQSHQVGYEAGFCTTFRRDFNIQAAPDPQCAPRTSDSATAASILAWSLASAG